MSSTDQPADDSAHKALPTLVEALKLGMSGPGEQRLYRTGKLPGLFAARTGTAGAAAALAVRDGYVEVVRTETKGKTATDWVRVTAKGIDLVMQRESPTRAMDELRAALQLTKDGLPAWIVQIRQGLQELANRCIEQVTATARRLEALSERIEQALEQAEAAAPKVPPDAADAFPWAQEVLTYLDRRRETGVDGACPLPELYTTIRCRHGDLSVLDYHTGLRRLHDRGLVKLIPFDGTDPLPQPEYALLDGACVYYYVSRGGAR